MLLIGNLFCAQAKAWDSETGSGVVSAQESIVRTSLEATEVLQSDALTNLYGVTILGGTVNYTSFDSGGVQSFRNVVSSRDVMKFGNDQFLQWRTTDAVLTSNATVRLGVSTDDYLVTGASFYAAKTIKTTITPNKCVQTNAEGVLSPASGTCGVSGSAEVSGSDTQVQYNNSGAFGADAGLTWNKVTSELTVTGTNGSGIIFGNFPSGTGGYEITATNQTASNTAANDISILGKNGSGTGEGSDISIFAGDGGATGGGGDIDIYSGYSGAGGGGGLIQIVASDGGNVRLYNDDGGNVYIGLTNTDQILYTTTDDNGSGGADHFFDAGDATGTGGGGNYYFATGNGSGSNQAGGGFFVDFGTATGTGKERYFDFGSESSLTAERNGVNFGLGNVSNAVWIVNSGASITNQRFFTFLDPTLNGVSGGGAETVTNAATIYVNGPPHGSNINIVSPYSLWIASGDTLFASGNVTIADGGFMQTQKTIASDATTFSAILGNIFTTSCNTVPTAITAITGAQNNKIIYINGGCDTNATSLNDSGIFKLASNIRLSFDDSIILKSSNNATFVEQGRSDN